jgi:hypothetical protein
MDENLYVAPDATTRGGLGMLVDRWDLGHICIAVDDLDAAMERYSRDFGMEWSAIMTFTEGGLVLGDGSLMEMPVTSPVHGEGVSMEGLREVWGTRGIDTGDDVMPAATIELCSARPFSPAYTIWGCPTGQEYVHHIAWWVEDTEAESRNLIDQGYRVEFTTPPGDLLRGFGYLLSPFGLRVELQPVDFKGPTADILRELAEAGA